MGTLRLALRTAGFALLLCLLAAQARGAVVLDEDFSDNSAGWTLDFEWQIGAASASAGHNSGSPDPAADHTATADNGVAGAIIGGNVTTVVHAFYYLTSPAMDLTAGATANLSFWRWLNSDYSPFMTNKVDVWNGLVWVTIWQSGGAPPVQDAAWTPQSFDITPYINAAFRVRFGHSVGQSGAFMVSGWNLDDVLVLTDCGDADGDGYPSVACGGWDCDDLDDTVYPGAPELCDGLDNDCDGAVDENGVVYYPDADGDGFGLTSGAVLLCSPLSGYVLVPGDCDDGNDTVYPGATELFDGLDNDCDGTVDEGFGPLVLFEDDFSDNSEFWSLGNEWQIGPAAFSFGQEYGNPDPTQDHTPTGDNGVAGANLGDNISTSFHGTYYLTSRIIEVFPTGVPVKLSFWRWLNSDVDPYMTNRVEVYNGSLWITIWQSTGVLPGIADNAWTEQVFDITPYLNPAMQIRFGHSVGATGAKIVSGWNLDDVRIAVDCSDQDGDGVFSVACGGDDCDDSRADVYPGAPEVLDGVDNDCDGVVDEGFENPIFRSIADVPNDQGRAVRLRWRGHALDAPGSPTPVQSYSIFRQVQPGQAPAQAASAARPEEALALPPGDWDLLTTLAAFADTAYQTVVPTLCDSNATAFCRTTFVVRARFLNPADYADSAPDSGWSVDNIVPGPPAGLIVNLVSGSAELSWQPSPAPDFQYFRIYRGSSADFETGPGSLVHTTAGTSWSDAAPGGGAVYYKVSTVDANGNESAPAETAVTVDVASMPLPTVLALTGITPNPFSTTAGVRFDLPSGTKVRVTIHDIAGRRVRTLVSESLPPGRYERLWDASDDRGQAMSAGVYVVRLDAGGQVHTRRLVLVP